MTDAYVAVGSNIDPAANIPEALARLMDAADVVAVSTFYRVRPLDRPAQPDYRNGVFRLRTELDPVQLHHDLLRGIETAIGRERSDDPHAARPIDLDLVLFGDEPFRDEGLVLPDPDIVERNFLAVPLAELTPDARLLQGRRRLADVATDLGRAGLTEDRPLTRTLREMLSHEHKPH